MSETQRTLILLKPDTIQRGLVGPIITRFERIGLKIVGLKLMQIDEALAERHYAIHENKPFFPGLVRFITSSPIIATVFEGPQAVEVVRKAMGETDPAKAVPGTVRGDFGLDIGRNLVHGSDGPDTAEREIALFFSPSELLSYSRDHESWIAE